MGATQKLHACGIRTLTFMYGCRVAIGYSTRSKAYAYNTLFGSCQILCQLAQNTPRLRLALGSTIGLSAHLQIAV